MFSGYNVSLDLIELMQDYCDNEQDYASSLISFTEKWNSRLKQQSTLVSYHTTKRAQLDCVRVCKEVAHLKRTTCQEIQKVIDNYRQYVNETFVVERFRPVRRHNQSVEIKKSFKLARISVRQINDELKSLTTQLERARELVRTAESNCEAVDLDTMASKKQRQKFHEALERRRFQLEEIEKKIIRTKEKEKSAEKVYRKKATDIFKRCQFLEEERLDRIRETLLDFVQSMHTSHWKENLEEIYKKLNDKITTNQNSFDDLMFWAKNYGIQEKISRNDDDQTSSDESSTTIEENSASRNRSTRHKNVLNSDSL